MAGAITFWNGTNIAVNNAGSSGQACISGGTGAPTFGTLSVGGGGTGLTTLTTAYGVVCAGTTATGALQNAGAGTTGQVLTSGGSSALPSYQNAGLQIYAIRAAVSSSPYVVGTDYFIPVDTSTTAITVQLPNAPATGRIYVVKDASSNAATRNITVTTVGGTVNIDGATSYTMSTNDQSAQFIFNGTKYFRF